MALPAVITRELRAQARRPGTYWLRVLSAGTLTGVFGYAMWTSASRAEVAGTRAFGALNLAVYLLTWACLPFVVADCLSRERRENTLGLLALTPLRPWEIVMGKMLISVLQGGVLLVAAFPVLCLPTLLGGVTWQSAVMSVCLQLSALLLALTAGVVASSLSVRSGRALVAAGTIAAALGLGYVWVLSEAGQASILAVWLFPEYCPPKHLAMAARVSGFGLGGALALALGGVLFAAKRIGALWQEPAWPEEALRRRVAGWIAFGLLTGLGLALLSTCLSLWRSPRFYAFGWVHALFVLALWALGPAFAVMTRARPDVQYGGAVAGLNAARRTETSSGAGRGVLLWWLVLGLFACVTFGPAAFLGALSPEGFWLSVLNDLSALCWAMGAGWLAYAWRRPWTVALAWGWVGSVLLGLAFCLLQRCAQEFPGHLFASPLEWWQRLSDLLDRGGFSAMVRDGLSWIVQVGRSEYGWNQAPRFGLPGGASGRPYLVDAACILMLSLGALVVCRWLASRTRPAERHAPRVQARKALEDEFCRVIVAPAWFHRAQRRLLDRNPMRWLQQRHWGARLAGWGWCATVVVLGCWGIFECNWVRVEDVAGWVGMLVWFLAVGLSLAAASSFREERQTGALELILVTPLSAGQVVGGRLAGLGVQFAPALAVAALLGILALRQYPADWRFWFCCRWLAVALGALIAAPAAGLYWSLRFGQTVKAWLAAWLSILLSGLPFVVLACRTVFGLSNGGYDRSRPAFSMACCAGALLWGILAAWVFWRITRRSLIRREFPLI